MKLTEVREEATCCVILSSEFQNLGEWVFFADEDHARAFAKVEGGRVVDEGGLAEKFASMHRAEGRQPNQSYRGRYVEYPNQSELDELGITAHEWMERYWDGEYAASARDEFRNATVHGVDYSDYTLTIHTDVDYYGVGVSAGEARDMSQRIGSLIAAQYPGIQVEYSDMLGAGTPTRGPESRVIDEIDATVSAIAMRGRQTERK